MGGFFLSNSKPAVERASAFFSSIALPFDCISLGDFQLLLLRKKYVRSHNNWYESPQGRIAGVGTWLTADSFGHQALAGIMEATRSVPSSLGDIAGNFAFVVQQAGELAIVTDKTGVYPVYTATEGNARHYSSSLLAIVEALDRVQFNKQAILEFISVEAVLGLATLFENVRTLPHGTIVTIDPKPSAAENTKRYYQPEDRPISVDELPEILIEQFRRLANSKLSAGDICCDLSGGYDSRTVAALLHRAGIGHTLNTNVNSTDPSDHLAALHAAQVLQRPIVLYNFSDPKHEKAEPGYVFSGLDMARDVHWSRQMLVSFESKAERHALLLGGYGGELLRDVYSQARNVAEVITKNYTKGLAISRNAKHEYDAQLAQKFHSALAYAGFQDDERASERIYFFEKMRVWGGTRIAVYNRYAFGWHPLLDHRVQRHLFTIAISRKANARLQREIIALDAELAKQPYTQSPKQQKPPLRRFINSIPALRTFKGTRRRLKRAVVGNTPAPVPAGYETPIAEFKELTELGMDICISAQHRTRYLTLVDAFIRYRAKIGT